MRRAFAGFTTRSLLVCVVLGAFTAAFVHLSRILGVIFWSTAPWLGAPAPIIPWYLMIIVAALLVPRFGSALITGIIGSVVGVGTMALLAAIIVEAVFAVARSVQRRRSGGIAPVGDRSGLWWAILAGVAAGAMSYGFMFTVQEFRLLPGGLMLLALAIRIATGAIFGWLAFLIVRGLLRAGFDPEGGRRHRAGTVPARAAGEPDIGPATGEEARP